MIHPVNCSVTSLRQIYFVITRRCNLFCSHCIRSSGPDVHDELSFEWAQHVLRKLRPFAEHAEMIISGGEPTLHPKFMEIAKLSCELYPFTNINTNGLRVAPLLELAKQYGNVGFQVSIDGNEDYHNKIRGANTFSRSLGAIRKLADLEAQVVVATTLSNVNLDSLIELDNALQEIPFKVWTIQKEVIYGRADHANSIPTEQWNEFVEYAHKHFKNSNRLKTSTMFDFARMGLQLDHPHEETPFQNCGTGRSKLYVNPDLTVFPCGCLEEVILGDLSKEEPEKILQRMAAMPTSPSPSSPCQVCPFLKQCNGGCPGASLHKYGSFGVGDPRCKAVKELIGEYAKCSHSPS